MQEWWSWVWHELCSKCAWEGTQIRRVTPYVSFYDPKWFDGTGFHCSLEKSCCSCVHILTTPMLTFRVSNRHTSTNAGWRVRRHVHTWTRTYCTREETPLSRYRLRLLGLCIFHLRILYTLLSPPSQNTRTGCASPAQHVLRGVLCCSNFFWAFSRHKSLTLWVFAQESLGWDLHINVTCGTVLKRRRDSTRWKCIVSELSWAKHRWLCMRCSMSWCYATGWWYLPYESTSSFGTEQDNVYSIW